MATDAVTNSSGDEISFSEWQFVGKSNCEFSDDESIEIIEREVLRSETPSSCSEEEKEDEPDIVIEEEKEDEPEIGEWVVPLDPNSCICLDSDEDEESLFNATLEVETSLRDTDQNTLHCSYAPKESHVTATSINNFSRKVLYSCVLAAVISVVIHQYRGNLLDILLNRTNETKSEGADHSPQDDALNTPAELKQQPADFKIRSDDEVVQDLVNKREQFKKLCEKYEIVLDNTFIPKSNIYAVEVSVLRKLFERPVEDPSTLPSEPCEEDIDDMNLPNLCTDSSGKTFYFMTKEEYHRLMRGILNTVQFDEDKMHNFVHTLPKKLEPPASLLDFQSFDDKIPAEKTTTSKNTNEAELSDIPKKIEAESKLQEVIEEVRTLYRKIKDQVENLDRMWTKCTDNKEDSCIIKRKSVSEQNETYLDEEKKINTTHDGETKTDDSVLEFIYQTPPVTERWTLKMDSKPSSDTNQHERSNDDWLTKMGKAKEKYRKRHKEKSDRKKAQKARKLNDESEHELYKRYKEFLSQTREKIKVDYKKFASHFKSKLKKFGDGVKRNYEKLISSDWKHYAKSVFQSFHF